MATSSDISKHLEERQGDLPVPAAIAAWEVEMGGDADGDAAVWVWVILEDEHIDEVWPLPIRDRMRERVRSLVLETTGPGVMVYIRFRTRSEHEALAEERKSA